MSTRGLTLVIAYFLASCPAWAWNSGCDYQQAIQNGTVVNRFATTALGCALQLTPQIKPDLVYREYWFDERGRFLVFESIAGDNVETATGTRSYFFFPRKQNPSFSILPDGNIQVVMSDGSAIRFLSKTARIEDIPGAKFTEDQDVNLKNSGGVEFQSWKGIYLDAGWKIGTPAYMDPNGQSVFKDAEAHSCAVKNNEVFFYINTYYGEPNFTFSTDADLATFLKKRCPTLDVSSLVTP